MIGERWLIATTMLCLSSAQIQSVYGQDRADPKQQASYHLKMSVDEVNVTFHALDAHGLPVDDLRLDEIDLFDNDQGPGRILALRQLQSSAIRMAFLVDTSGSVANGLAHVRMVAAQAVQGLLRDQTDSGLLVEFGNSRSIVQPWTKDVALLARDTSKITANPLAGTSFYDALFSTCFHEMGQEENKDAHNVLLLFTDGEDTDSHVTFQEAADACQRTSTAIYVFDTRTEGAPAGIGPQSLRRLAEQTGGRFFSAGKSDPEIHGTLQTVRSDLFDGYRLIYRPNQLRRDGSFHRIVLVGPQRVANIAAASGFYAPKP